MLKIGRTVVNAMEGVLKSISIAESNDAARSGEAMIRFASSDD
jgi:hypothetical protein